MSDLPALPTTQTLSLDKNVLKNLTSWEDYLTYYIQLDTATTAFSWWKADLLLSLYQKFGEGSLNTFAREIGTKTSTVINYIRVARAFPPHKRIAILSFSHHFIAAFADGYNDKTQEFDGERRFDYIEQAADMNFSTRALKEEIDRGKRMRQLDVPIVTCYMCGDDQGDINIYAFYSGRHRRDPDKFDLHEVCYLEVLQFIEQKHAQTKN